MRFRAPAPLNPGAALAAALLLALPGFALAEDATPPAAGNASPPIIEDVSPPATGDESAPAKESNICFTGEGSIKEVLDACAAYIASNPGDKDRVVTAHSVRAMGFSATGKYDDAITEMTTAIEVDPAQANSYFMRAAAYETKKDYDKAIADLDKAVGLDATRGDFFLLRGIVYADKGDLDRALTEMNEKVRLDPDLTNGYLEARQPLSPAQGLRQGDCRLRPGDQDRSRRPQRLCRPRLGVRAQGRPRQGGSRF